MARGKATASGMKIELRRIDDVRPYEGNPRVNDQAVEAVAASLKEFGFRQPIVVDSNGVIIVGHTRWKAAKKLGLVRVPVHVAKDLSPEQAKAYRIADNQTARIAEWDYGRLLADLVALDGKAFDLTVLGFTNRTLQDLLRLAKDEEPEGRAVGIEPAWQVVVECENEKEQRQLYGRLLKEGRKCRLLTL